MNINTKLLISIIVLLLGFGGYYFYSQHQQKEDANKVLEKIHSAPLGKWGF